MVAEPGALLGTRDRPNPRATGAMASTTGTSSEDGARTPARSPRAGEEQEGKAATRISADFPTGPAEVSSAQSPSASDISGFGNEATDPDDESRPVTEKEFTKSRHRVEKTFQRMYADVMGLLQKEVEEQNRQREDLKLLMVEWRH